MHHAYCVIALLWILSEASIYLRTPCHILFLLRYIHESFLRFWLNANNSECFCLPTMLLEIPKESITLPKMKSAPKVRIIYEKRKLLDDIFLRIEWFYDCCGQRVPFVSHEWVLVNRIVASATIRLQKVLTFLSVKGKRQYDLTQIGHWTAGIYILFLPLTLSKK